MMNWAAKMPSPFFKVSPGHVECPKCFGWQIIDYTKRNPASGWPIGQADIRDCDHCKGLGELPKPPNPWSCTDKPVEPPRQVTGPPRYYIDDVPIDGQPAHTVTQYSIDGAPPTVPSGWPMFKEPG